MKFSLNDIMNIQKNGFVEEPNVAFPQANSFSIILNSLNWMDIDKTVSSAELAIYNSITERQGTYYMSAMYYIGLVERTEEYRYKLSPIGYYAKNSLEDRNSVLAYLILSHRVFYKVFEAYLMCFEMPDSETLLKIIKASKVHINDNDEMFRRRVSTVSSWVQWIINNANLI